MAPQETFHLEPEILEGGKKIRFYNIESGDRRLVATAHILAGSARIEYSNTENRNRFRPLLEGLSPAEREFFRKNPGAASHYQ